MAPWFDSSRRGFGFRGRAWRFAADAVAQHQEWQPEEPKRVIGAQLAVGDVDIEFLFETRHPQCRQFTRRGLDEGQVMAGVRQALRLVNTRPPPARARGTRVAVKLDCGNGNPTLT